MIYQRHLINTLIVPLVMTMAIIVSLVWLSQIMKLSYIIELGVGIVKFTLLTLSVLPTVALSTMPLAASVACFFGYNYLYFDRELIALSTSGLSNMQIATPAIKLALGLTFLSYMLSFFLSPMSYHMLKEDMNYLRGNYISSAIHERTFDTLSKNVVLFVDKKESSSKMSGIIMFDHRKNNSVTVFAKMGQLTTNGDIPVFELYDGMRQEVDSNGYMNQMTFAHLVVPLPSKHEVRSKNIMDLQEYDIFELINPKGDYSDLRLKQLNAEKHQRFIWPGYVVALVMLTLGIYLREPYSRVTHKTLLIKVALSIAVVLYLHFTFHNLSVDRPNFNIVCYINLLATIFLGYRMLKD